MKPTTKRNRTARAIVTTDVPDATIITVPEPTEPTAPAAFTFHDAARIADANIDPAYVVPAYVPAFAAAFRAVASMPSVTRDERIAVTDAFTAAMDAAMPGIVPNPSRRNDGRWTGLNVQTAQNVLYVSAALSNVPLTNGHIMSAWRAELPGARCDFHAKSYAWSTLTDYMATRHGGTPMPGSDAIVRAWAARGRRPIA